MVWPVHSQESAVILKQVKWNTISSMYFVLTSCAAAFQIMGFHLQRFGDYADLERLEHRLVESTVNGLSSSSSSTGSGGSSGSSSGNGR